MEPASHGIEESSTTGAGSGRGRGATNVQNVHLGIVWRVLPTAYPSSYGGMPVRNPLNNCFNTVVLRT